jgi:hypothetical protein
MKNCEPLVPGQQVRPVEAEVGMELVGELVAGPAPTAAERVPALDHEVGDHPVEHGAVIQFARRVLAGARVGPLPAALGKLDEIAYRLRRVIGEKADYDLPMAREQGRGQRVCHGLTPRPASGWPSISAV